MRVFLSPPWHAHYSETHESRKPRAGRGEMPALNSGLVFDPPALSFRISPLPPHARKPGEFPRAPRRVASHPTLTSNHLTQWLQAIDSLRKAGVPASEGDPWQEPENVAEAGL
jgi:hypothetical protein